MDVMELLIRLMKMNIIQTWVLQKKVKNTNMIKGMKRVFKMKKNSQEIVLDDPNVNMSPAEVMDFYSMNYPELTTATVHGPEIEDDRAVYEFKTTIGVKG